MILYNFIFNYLNYFHTYVQSLIFIINSSVLIFSDCSKQHNKFIVTIFLLPNQSINQSIRLTEYKAQILNIVWDCEYSNFSFWMKSQSVFQIHSSYFLLSLSFPLYANIKLLLKIYFCCFIKYLLLPSKFTAPKRPYYCFLKTKRVLRSLSRDISTKTCFSWYSLLSVIYYII